MSRGKVGTLASFFWLALGSVLLCSSPLGADNHITTTDDEVGSVDNLPPGLVQNLGGAQVEGADSPTVRLEWGLSADDFLAFVSTGDPTSGGTFVLRNEVASYGVWRDGVEITTEIAAGSTSYEELVDAGATYTYIVRAIDAAGNQSEDATVEVTVAAAKVKARVVFITPSNVPFYDLQLHTRTVAVQAAVRSAVLAALEQLTGLPASQITIISITIGSLLVDFELLASEDETQPSPEEAFTSLQSSLDSDPESLGDAVNTELAAIVPTLSEDDQGTLEGATVGAATVAEIVQESLNLGSVAKGESVSVTRTISNALGTDDDVTIEATGDGFSADVSTLTVPAGGDATYTIIFDATAAGDIAGDYEGSISERTSDPDNPGSDVSLRATILPGPQEIDIVGSALTFSGVPIGSSRTATTTVRNLGELDLTIMVTLSGDAEFSIDQSGEFTITAGGEEAFVVTYSPTAAVSSSGQIDIASDDADEPSLSVSLTGTGASGDEVCIDNTDATRIIRTDYERLADSDQGLVNILDFFQFVGKFNSQVTDPDFDAAFDLDSNDLVDISDFTAFVGEFGAECTYTTGATFDVNLTGDQQ